LDVDLEDKLLYGLTPTRLAYLVIGLLAAFAIWSAHWAPSAIRATIAGTLAVMGAAAAWGRWHRRPLDGWAVDLFLFAASSYRLQWRLPRPFKRR
jgi:hypothetical protein